MPVSKRVLTGRLPRILGALCLIFASIACSTTSGTSGPSDPPVPAAKVFFCNNSNPHCTPETSFSIGSLRDLYIFVRWTNVPAGTHAQKLDILLPGDGGLFQTYTASFAINQHPSGSITTKRAFPVAGTWITQRAITGAWQVQVFLDGQSFGTQTIELNP
jgi:hypothetical protein